MPEISLPAPRLGTPPRPLDPYVRSLFEALGARDPYQVQSELLPALEREIEGMSEAELRTPEREGKWSVVQVLQHLADSELMMSARIRMALAHPEPPLQSWDQDLWARALRYETVAARDALDQLRALRAANLRLLRSLDGARLDRAGIHAERGRETVRQMVRLVAGHDLVHLRQIARIKQALAARADA